MTEDERLLRNCFAAGDFEFALHQSDQIAALEYLKHCIESNTSWNEVEIRLREHLDRVAPNQHTNMEVKKIVETQMFRAQALFAPWLDDIEQGENENSNVKNLHD